MDYWIGVTVGTIGGFCLGIFVDIWAISGRVRKGRLPKFLKDLGVKLPEKGEAKKE